MRLVVQRIEGAKSKGREERVKIPASAVARSRHHQRRTHGRQAS